jgi:hypothetical protein
MRNVKNRMKERKKARKSFITVLSGIIFLWGEWWGSSSQLYGVMVKMK